MFYLSEILDLLLAPSLWLIAIAMLGLVMIKRWKVWGWRLAIGAIGLLLVLGILPIGDLLIRPLEARFPGVESDGARSWPINQRPHIAVVLGGAVQPSLTEDFGKLAVNGAAERLLATADMAKREPGLAMIISGGAGSLWSSKAEAPLIADWLVDQGVSRKHLIIDDKSRNTFENAAFTMGIIERSIPADVPFRLAVITSAAHMPRAIGSFRRAAMDAGLPQLELLAYPVDYRSAPVPLLRIQRVGQGLANLDAASREWFALLAYFLLDRIESPLPAPPLGREQDEPSDAVPDLTELPSDPPLPVEASPE